MSWDEGYVSQIEYSHCYCGELNPLRIKLMMLAHGYQPSAHYPLRYLELGVGQGLSLNMHAAACGGEFWGNDFMPSHAGAANVMADMSGANVTVLDDSFAELAARDDLPEFDIIALHGVWSWISAENHRHIVKIIQSHLKVGGIVYISYNTSPGQTSMIPIRDLMMLHMNTVSAAGNNVPTKINSALAFMKRLKEAEAVYLNKTPLAAMRFNKMLENTAIEDLAHEFFNASWAITSFTQMATQMTSAKLAFVGSGIIQHFFSTHLLSAKIKKMLSALEDPLLYESTLDFCVNRMFRGDLWVKGSQRLPKHQQLHLLGEMRFTLVAPPPADEALVLNTYLGDVSLDQRTAALMMATLAENNFEPKTIVSLLSHPSLKHLNLSQACDMILFLCGVWVTPAQDEKTIASLTPTTDKLNTFLMNQSLCSDRLLFLASPVTGGGISVPRLHQLALLAIRNGSLSVDDVANFIWEILSSQEQFVVTSEGVPCNGKSENLKELTLLVTSFFETRLPILTALKIS